MSQRAHSGKVSDDTHDAGSDGGGSQDEELTTHKPRENPESTSKPGNKRGPTRKQDKAQAFLAKSQEIYEASGRIWVPGLRYGGIIKREKE